MLQRADNWAVDKIQDAYLWLLDRTGCYCGTLIFLSWMSMIATHLGSYSQDRFLLWMDMFFTLIALLIAGTRYYLQGVGMYIQYNAMALIDRANVYMRIAGNALMLSFLVPEILTAQFSSAIGTIGIILYYHLVAVCIRDREKKPFFEFKSKMVPQAT